MMRRGRRRRGRQGRLPTPVFIEHTSDVNHFEPHPVSSLEPITLEHDELEVLRLVNLENLSQEEAGKKMGVSRGTIWRLLERARRKVTQALVEGRRLVLASSEDET